MRPPRIKTPEECRDIARWITGFHTMSNAREVEFQRMIAPMTELIGKDSSRVRELPLDQQVEWIRNDVNAERDEMHNQILALEDKLKTALARASHLQRERDRLVGLFQEIETCPPANVRVIRDQDGRIIRIELPDDFKAKITLAPSGPTL